MSRIVCQFSCGAASAVATKLTLAEYGDRAIKVFETVGYIKGQNGAACTTRIKRGLLRTFEQPGDVLVLGYTPVQSAGVTAMFFCTSFARSWAIREAFRKWLS